MKRVFLAALCCLAATAGRARADDSAARAAYRAVVDKVELEPASIGGERLRVYLSALAIEGQRLDLTDPKSLRLYVGGGELKAPFALGTFDASGDDVALIVLVQATSDFSDELPLIADSLDKDLLAALGDRAQLAVMSYGESTGTGKLAPAKAARAKVALAPEASAGDPALLDTLDRALQMLRKAPPPEDGRTMRKLIVVIGDGRDLSGDRDRATRLGARAAKEGVRIHTIAYSPADVRRPLLFLGELSKKSLGTLRWPGRGHKPTADSWSDTFKQLAEEVEKQYVLTFFVSDEDDVVGKRLHVVTIGRTEATSNELKVPEPSCAGSACEGWCATDHCVVMHEASSSGILRYLLWIGAIVVGAIVLLGTVGAIMTKRQEAHAAATGAPPPPRRGKQPPAPPPPGFLANGRPIPGLLVTTGPLAGQRFLLREKFAIGKQPGNDLVIDDGFASSAHAQIAMDGNGDCTLVDLGSTNGTFINGVRLHVPQALQHGVTIRIGSTDLIFLAQ